VIYGTMYGMYKCTFHPATPLGGVPIKAILTSNSTYSKLHIGEMSASTSRL